VAVHPNCNFACLFAPSTAMSKLEVTSLAMRFGPRWLFRDLSFELGPGEIMAVTGSNGSGKSTLVRILAGVLTPTRGKVAFWLNGSEVHKDDRARRVALVAPYLHLYDGLTLEENLRFVTKVRADRSRAPIQQLMERVTLADRAGDLVGTFSSGMKQRARFAVALAAESELLLLDEPSSNLDAAGVELVKQIIDSEVGAGRSVVLATNSREEREWCERSLAIGDFLRP